MSGTKLILEEHSADGQQGRGAREGEEGRTERRQKNKCLIHEKIWFVVLERRVSS